MRGKENYVLTCFSKAKSHFWFQILVYPRSVLQDGIANNNTWMFPESFDLNVYNVEFYSLRLLCILEFISDITCGKNVMNSNLVCCHNPTPNNLKVQLILHNVNICFTWFVYENNIIWNNIFILKGQRFTD